MKYATAFTLILIASLMAGVITGGQLEQEQSLPEMDLSAPTQDDIQSLREWLLTAPEAKHAPGAWTIYFALFEPPFGTVETREMLLQSFARLEGYAQQQQALMYGRMFKGTSENIEHRKKVQALIDQGFNVKHSPQFEAGARLQKALNTCVDKASERDQTASSILYLPVIWLSIQFDSVFPGVLGGCPSLSAAAKDALKTS